jgi:DNA-binding transcriptional LysR family regulator
MASDLNDTLIFAKVVEKSGFVAAARALGIPKTTVSRKVQELEQRLGARLLKRTTRNIGLTEAGQAYFEHCKNIVRELAEAEAAVAQLQGAPRGWLRVAAPYTLGARLVTPLLAEFLARFPDIRIQLTLSNEIVDLIASDIDMALRVGPLADSTLGARRLGTFTSSVYASPDYLERYGEPLAPADLRHHRALALSQHRRNEKYLWSLINDGQSSDYPVAPIVVVNDPASIRTAALAGMGVALLGDFFVARYVANGRLRAVLPAWSGAQNEFNAVFPPGRALSPKVRSFVDFLAERLVIDASSAAVVIGDDDQQA